MHVWILCSEKLTTSCTQGRWRAAGDKFSRVFVFRVSASRFCLVGFSDGVCSDRWQETQYTGRKKRDPRSLIAMATSAYLPPLRLSLWVGCAVQDYSGLNCDIYLRRSLKEHLGRHFQPKRSIGKCVCVWRGKAAVVSYNNFATHEWGTKNMQYY